jgi:hypothetical protein
MGEEKGIQVLLGNMKGRRYFEGLGRGGDDNEMGLKEMWLVSVDWNVRARDRVS